MRRLQCRFSVLLVLALVGFAGLAAAAAEKSSTPLQPMDVFQFEFASDPQISPDGRHVVYVRNSMDVLRDRQRSALWIVAADATGHRPLSADGPNSTSPRWSPDGTRVAYVSKTSEDNGPAQIFCRWMDTGQTARLTQLTRAPEHLTWSPDGKWLAFTMLVDNPPEPYVQLPLPPEGAKWADPPRVIRKVLYRHDGKGYLEDGFQHVFVLPAEGGTPRQLTSGNYHHNGPLAWSAESDAVYFSANRNDDWEYDPRESELFRVAVADRSLTRLTDRRGPDESPVVSPDGGRIAWLGFDDRKLSYQNTRLYIMDVDGGNRRELTAELDRSVDAPVWHGDGKGLFVQYDDVGTTKIAFVDLEGKLTERASHLGGVTIGRPYASGSFSANAHGELAYTRSLPDHPADVVATRKNSSSFERLTELNADLFAQRKLGDVEEIWFRSSVDGRRIQAWIVTPPGFDRQKKYPLILEIHGGPFANYGDRFAAELQYYAAAGYVVLYVNPRGSTGYGEEFANLIHHDYPGRDYDDLMSAVDAVLERGFVDEDNLFVTGGSGGGVLTAWIVGKTDRFRAAVSAKPVINWYSFALTSDVYPYFNGYWFPGVPWEHASHYLRRSPISLAGNVTTPTMLLTGEEDHRTPISESEQFYQALKMRKVETVLVRIPGASHAIVNRPSRLIAKVQLVLKWFETHAAGK